MDLDILAIVTNAILAQNDILDEPIDLSMGVNTPLFGDAGQVDSLTLVSIILSIDERVYEETGIKIHLASTGDLPLEASPFASVKNLIQHIQTRLPTNRTSPVSSLGDSDVRGENDT